MSPNVFEINEDKIYKDKCCGEFYAMEFFFVMLKRKCRTSKNFAGPADARCYWSYRASIIFRLALRPAWLNLDGQIFWNCCF